MRTFAVLIQEEEFTLRQVSVNVEADDLNQAMRIADANLNNGQYDNSLWEIVHCHIDVSIEDAKEL
jgi:hypothetical protein